MPDENANPVGTTQTGQNNQTVTKQSGDDFVLDFGDLGNDNGDTTKEVQVDSLMAEEEKDGDELGFDIDLGSDSQDSSDNSENTIVSDNSVANDVSVNMPEEEPVNDFDISMDYEGNSEEAVEDKEEIIPEEAVEDKEEIIQEETVEDKEEITPEETVEEKEEIVPEEAVEDKEEIVPEETVEEKEEIVPEEAVEDKEEITPEEAEEDKEEIIPEEAVEDKEEIIPEEAVEDKEEIIPEETVEDKEEIIPEEEPSDESMNFVKNEGNELDDLDFTDKSHEGPLFHQIDEENQNEISFELNDSNNVNDISQAPESVSDEPIFMRGEDSSINESEDGDGEITFDLPQISDSVEGLQNVDIEAQEQRQPELGDLLLNSPIDLSKELNDTTDNLESDLGNLETSVDAVDDGDSIISGDKPSELVMEETISTPVTDESVPEISSQEENEGLVASEGNNNLLSEAPQIESYNQNIDGNIQAETLENSIETQSQEPQEDSKRSEIVNNAVSETNEQSVTTSEINITAPVELSNMSSSQRESTPVESEGQVQSTLSLDQILDSELLSNPQYTDTSKASPQSAPVSEGKSKMGLFVGVGVAALACCVAVLAFPSISGDRKAGDTVNTGTFAENPGNEEPHPSAFSQPTGREDPSPIVGDSSQVTDIPDTPSISGGGGGQVVSFPEEGDDSGNDDSSAEPVPYVRSGEGDTDEPNIEDPIIEEVDANQILDIILSFKSQAETYYSHGEQSVDKQLMKYSLKLISLCDNYSDRINNGEGLDPESLSSFKSSANKIISKINTYLGGDDDVQVIREATIDGESNFEGKDEIKNYLYNNR